jgi:small subunit ribosomal protein S16
MVCGSPHSGSPGGAQDIDQSGFRNRGGAWCMAVKLRLKRFGRNHKPIYRLGAMDTRSPRDGRVLEELGHYDPTNKQADQQVILKADRIQHWLRNGAQPSETVKHLLKKHGIKV